MTSAAAHAEDQVLPRRIWLVPHFEPIPTETEARPMRAGLLARKLAERGHDVTWWTPDFDHYGKRHRTGGDAEIPVNDRFRVRLIRSLGYQRHVGPRRLLHHELLASRWRRAVATLPPPDLVVSGWPTPEFAASVVAYAGAHGIPSVVDIRDLWPDLWIDRVPAVARPAARLALRRYYDMARLAMSGASAIVGVTDEYVDWGVQHAGRPRSDDDRAFAFRFRAPEPAPADLELARNRLAELGFTPDDRLTLVFAGAFGRSYGLDVAVEAGRRLDRDAPGRVRIVLLGSGDRWNRIADAARELDSVLVLPRVGLAELVVAYQHADLGLAPYLDIENFRRNVPNKIDEYLGAGLPVVAGVDGAIARLIDKHGVGRRYEPDDAASLAALAATLAEDRSEVSALRERVRTYRSTIGDTDEIARLASHLEDLASRSPDGAAIRSGS
jgi:glycosyltransferase involved in cell wall biosynthesis